jgi:hypothetical protein
MGSLIAPNPKAETFQSNLPKFLYFTIAPSVWSDYRKASLFIGILDLLLTHASCKLFIIFLFFSLSENSDHGASEGLSFLVSCPPIVRESAL